MELQPPIDRCAESVAQQNAEPIYAATPVGRIEPTHSPEYKYQPVFMIRYPVVTNLGTLVDVLL